MTRAVEVELRGIGSQTAVRWVRKPRSGRKLIRLLKPSMPSVGRSRLLRSWYLLYFSCEGKVGSQRNVSVE